MSLLDVSLTNLEALTAREGLIALGDVKLSYKPAYTVAKMKRKVQQIIEAIEEVRKRLTDTYGKRDEEGKLITTSSEGPNGPQVSIQLADPDGFRAEWDDLMQIETLLYGVRALPLSAFAAAPIAPDVLYSLGPLVYDDEEPLPDPA